jgi:hypothetical protein
MVQYRKHYHYVVLNDLLETQLVPVMCMQLKFRVPISLTKVFTG